MPVIILGGIYGGVFTPTEAAGVSVVYGFVVGAFFYRELKFKDIPQMLVKRYRLSYSTFHYNGRLGILLHNSKPGRSGSSC